MADDPQLASPKRNTSDSNHITKNSACNTPMAQKSPKQDMYWFAYAADPPAERHRRGLWAQQVDELASPEQELNGGTSAQKESPCSPLDTYWFAHAGGDAPSEDGTERRLSPDRSQAGDSESGGRGDLPQHMQLSQLSREERLRLVKERQEEQRARRLQELEHQAQAAQHYREQLEEERRRRIEEMRQRDHERRLQVEERKRLIWEADHERKEAMLKRNIERENKLDARRSTNRMSMSFAFGSSTPRTFDLDLATMSSAGAPVLMSAAPQRKSEERDFESSRKRAASAYNLCQAADADQTDSSPSQGAVPDVAFISPTIGGWLVGSGVTVGEDPMTRSMTALPSQHSRGRRKTDLMPVIPWNRSAAASASRSRSPATAPSSSSSGVAQRAVSMSRLDMLAQPRRPRLLPASPSSGASAATPPSMAAKSMLNLSSGSPPSRRGVVDMSQSMVLSGRGGLGSSKLQSARSMSQLAIAPRPTRASQLRATNRMAGSAATGKEQQSPSRPRSSMSVASEHSVASSQMSSSVVMRPRPPPRKPRPLSIAGTIPDKALQSRQNLVTEKTAPVMVEKKKSAKSSNGTEAVAGTAPEVPPKPAHLRKPQKPQPPAASAFRREQRPPAPPARTAKDTPPKERAGSKEKSLLVAKDPSHTVGPTQGLQASLPTAAVAPIVATAAAKPASVAMSGATEPATAPPDVVASNVIAAADQQQGTPSTENNASDVQAAVANQEQKAPVLQEVPITTGPAEQKPATFHIGVPEGPMQPAVQSADPSTEDVPSKPAPRVISEEEARALLAEKRRLAREQAEREAELERQRQEELRRQEEERLRLEEEEQRRAEEEQLRLAEEFRRQEEEKLQRAIEEQQKREAEERERRELEAQQKAEREEQERKAREEAERQRKELEERLKREEAERAERKKRVEEIMSRTRRRGAKDPSSANKAGSDAQASPERDSSPSVSGRSSPQPLQGKSSDEKGTQQEPSAAPDTVPSGRQQQSPKALEPEAAAPKPEGVGEDSGRREQGSLVNVAMLAAGSPEENCVNGREPIVVEHADSVADSGNSAGGGSQGGEGSTVVEEPMDQSPPHGKCFSPPSVASEGTAAPLPPCTNGYGSHHTNGGGDIINGVGSEKVADLIGLDSLGPLKPEALNTGSQAVENLRNSGDINSNRIVPTGNSLIGFEEDNRNNSAKTQEMQFTDLLS
ncbi:ensconsin-like isoform X3 [Dermacentor albipictus]|uniref:ensconsin-like isoform X3 n=1 Tax=Dermacentor albipictus TaxID=60249 RepID=UPI0038FCA35C